MTVYVGFQEDPVALTYRMAAKSSNLMQLRNESLKWQSSKLQEIQLQSKDRNLIVFEVAQLLF